MNKPIFYTLEELRSFDLLSGYNDVAKALSDLALSILGDSSTFISGFSASGSGMVVTLGEGRIFTQAAVDASTYGSLPADSTLIYQIGRALAQNLTLTTGSLTSGQGYWALIQVKFAQNDSVRSGDPNSGILPYYNVSGPSTPLNGPGGLGTVQNTIRKTEAIVSVKYGTPNVIGSEVPPTPDTNNVVMYLVNIVYGQTTINTSQIHVASPALGGTVPSNYPTAPFLAGLLNQHHTGVIGQAPKIVLTNGLEVQGILPSANMPPNLLGSTQEPAHTFFAGPSSGNPAIPSFRTIAADDLPAVAQEPANTVLAGPVSGAAAVPTFRGLTLADLPAGLGSFHYQAFGTNGIWTAPAGVTLAWLTMVGAGGGGAGSFANVGGLSGKYYDLGHMFTNPPTIPALTGIPALTRIDSAINFPAWGGAVMPDPLIIGPAFGVRWTGKVVPLYSETYTFYALTNDGCKLWINNMLIIDKWVDNSFVEYSGTITLVASQQYNIRLEYYERGDGGGIKLQWSSTSQAKVVIPQSQLIAGTGGYGGGAGAGLRFYPVIVTPGVQYSIAIGTGGNGGVAGGGSGQDGGSSSFGTITAPGGKGGTLSVGGAGGVGGAGLYLFADGGAGGDPDGPTGGAGGTSFLSNGISEAAGSKGSGGAGADGGLIAGYSGGNGHVLVVW